MAIAFARARYISRSAGGSATRSAAYNARVAIHDERTGENFSFAHREAPAHHEVLLPQGADARFADSATLWNAAEQAERQRNAQVARELVIALPANAELTDEDRLSMVRGFAQAHFVRHGLAVQLDIHTPREGEGEGDGDSEVANHHAHLLLTTRRIEGDRLAAKKASDLDPEVRWCAGRAVVTNGEAWGELWRDHQNRWFEDAGLAIRVDANAAVPQVHVGPVRMRAAVSRAVLRAAEIARENAVLAARDPIRVLATLTRNNATFSERDLDRYLAKYIHDEAEHLAVKAQVLGEGEVLALHDSESGEAIGRYTTRAVRRQEWAALSDAEAIVSASPHRRLAGGAEAAGLRGRTLRPDQREAFDHALSAGSLKIIEGRAGTGKSYTLQAIGDAHRAAGYRVVALAPTNSVAQDLRADGFAEAATVHSQLFALKNGRTRWTVSTLVMVDEAAMLDSRIVGQLLVEARASKAKLVLAGDDRQLTSIERGGLFTELRHRHGSAEILEVTRQTVDWQRQAARDMAQGRVREALSAFARNGALHWSGTQDEARAALVETWKTDSASDLAAGRSSSRFVFAYTNADVDALNADLRQVRKDRGELGEGIVCQTRHGPAEFAVGDRIQFTDTAKRRGIYNGAIATITAVDATGRISAVVDGPKGVTREVSWSALAFDGFRHGYAGTIYKGQGKTLDQTYLYHSHHWRQASSYVALTRQRERAAIFAATDTAADIGVLARQMSRSEVRAASVAWATAEELSQALRPGEALSHAPRSDPVQRHADALCESGWLVAPRVVAEPLDTAERALAVGSDPAVRREHEHLEAYLAGAYAEPRAAYATLRDLIERDGLTSASRRIAADPAQLGALRGRTDLFAGSGQRAERAQAARVAQSVAPALLRIAETERFAALSYDARAARDRAAEAVGVPRLSQATRGALERLAASNSPIDRTAQWAAIQQDPVAGPEVAQFLTTVQQRFGDEGMRAFARSGVFSGAKVGPGESEALSELGRFVHTIRSVSMDGRDISQGQSGAERPGLKR